MSILSKFTVRDNSAVMDRTIDKLLANEEKRKANRKNAPSVTPIKKQVNESAMRGYGIGKYNGD